MVELLIESAFDISSVPHPAFTMSCSDTDPYCVSYPAIVLPTEQILIHIAAESIAYGMLIPQCTYTQTVNRLFCCCCHSGHLSAYVGDSNSEIYWLTEELRH